jgi:uncharacterized membrane protein
MSLAMLESRMGVLEERISRVEETLGMKSAEVAGEKLAESEEVIVTDDWPAPANPFPYLRGNDDVNIDAPLDVRPIVNPPSQASVKASTGIPFEIGRALRGKFERYLSPAPTSAPMQPSASTHTPAPTQTPTSTSSPTPTPVMDYEAPARQTPPPQTGLERAIGLKWAGWIGAIVLVIGAGLGIKFAYDEGWFAVFSDSAKLALFSLAGFALIGAGEWVFRKVNKLSAVGLYGAGVAVLFLVSYAGHGFYSLYARNTAFALMGLSTVIGAAVAMRGNLVSIAVLSLVGGNLAPIVLSGVEPNLSSFLVYLLMLQVVALVLAGWGRESKWWMLRGLSLASSALWAFALIATHRPADERFMELMFLTVSAVLYQTELLVTAWNPRDPTAVDLSNVGVIFSTLVTAGLTAAVLTVLNDASDSVRSIWVLGIGAACSSLGFGLRTSAKPAVRAMATALRVQAGALLIVAVPVMFSGTGVEAGWAILAIAFAVISWRLDVRLARFAAVVTWMLAVAHLLGRGLVSHGPATDAAWLTVAGTAISREFVTGCMLALAGHLIAALVDPIRHDAAPRDSLQWIPTIGGTVLWALASLATLPPLGATLSLIIYAWLLLAGDLLTPRLAAAMQGAVVLVLATCKWVFADLLAERFATNWSPSQYIAVFNPIMGIGLLLAISLVALFWLRRQSLLNVLRSWGMGETAERDAVLIIAGLVIGLLTIGISFEIDRVIELKVIAGATRRSADQLRQMAFTMLWTVAGCGHLLLMRYIEGSPARRYVWLSRAGWLPIGMAIKYLTADTAQAALFSAAPSGVFFPLQALTASIVLGGLATVCFIAAESAAVKTRKIAGFLIVLVLLWTGAIAIDSVFDKLTISGSMARVDAHLAQQVARSIYGAVFAVLCVVAGFRLRAAAIRYFGLVLFALTLVKVVFVDLANAGEGYRVLSFLGVGLLLLGTSVLYGKLSPKLLNE